MIDVLYYVAALLAAVGVRKSNWTALPLLGSAAFCLIARAVEAPFNLGLWLTVDALAFVGVAWPLLPVIRAKAWARLWAYRYQIAVLFLFVPAVSAYAMPGTSAHLVSTVTGTIQLLLTFPLRRFLIRVWNTRLPPASHDDFGFLRVRACPTI